LVKKYILPFFLIATIAGCSAISLSGERSPASTYEKVSDTMKEFLEIESRHNPGKTVFDQTPLELSFAEIEIGEEMYQVGNHDQWFRGEQGANGANGYIFDEANYLPEDIKPYFYEERQGKKFVKFYFHPYDQRQSKEVLTYLSDNNIPFTLHESGPLKAYSTASKSLIAYDRNTGRSFSLKTSTDGTVQGTGYFEKRPYPTRWSYMVGLLSDSFKKVSPSLENLDIGWEPLITGIPAVDQSNSIRLMEKVSSGETMQVSGFVFNDNAKAKAIAERAGMSFDDFWEEAFRIKGRAMAEMGLYLGFLVSSNHAQNFRWELDNEGRLTGNIIFIDLSDGRPIRNIQMAAGNSELISQWERYVTDSNNIVEGNSVYFSNFFRGDHNSEIPQKWHKVMREGVVERVSEILEVDKETIDPLIVSGKGRTGIVSWGLDTDQNEDVKRAFAGHLNRLTNSTNGESCYRIIHNLLGR